MITYKNPCVSNYTVNAMNISARDPKGSVSEFDPSVGITTFTPGQTETVSASLLMTAADPLGTWKAFGSYQNQAGTFVVDNTLLSFVLTASSSATKTATSSATATKPVTLTVYFNTDSGTDNGYTIRTVDEAALNTLATALKSHPTAAVTIDGYTDNVPFIPGTPGPINTNQALSVARAQAVKNYLVSKGATQNKYTVTGHGATDFVAANGTNGNILNRRAVINTAY
jgi:outer membrane protein OmpA-like peptidoglycan-associated protein